MEEPQLPFYAVTSPLPVDGIVFAQVRPNAMRFKGVAEHNSDINGITSIEKLVERSGCSNWNELLQTWQHNLEQLASAFEDGYAKVDPLDMSTCQYCDLHPFCRIYDEETL